MTLPNPYPRYEALLTDRGNTTRFAVHPQGLSYSSALGGLGDASFTLRLEEYLLDGNPSRLDTWATEFLLMRSDDDNPSQYVPVFNGPVTGLQADGVTGDLQVTCKSAMAWLGTRPIESFRQYQALNVGQIVRDLVAYGQSAITFGPYADCRLTTGIAGDDGGPIYTVAYPQGEYRPVLDAITDLLSLDDSVDVTLDLTGPEDAVVRQVTTHYPLINVEVVPILQLGSRRVGSLSLTRDGDRMATRVYLLGASDGQSQLFFNANTGADESRYGVHYSVSTASDVTSYDVLRKQAQGLAKMLTPPLDLPTVAYRVSEGAKFDMVPLGGSVEVAAQRGWLSLDSYYRTVARQVTVDNNGPETVTLTLNRMLT